MAKEIVRISKITVNAVDLSDHCTSVTLTDEADEVDLTGMGSAYRENGQGLKTSSIAATFLNDHAANSVAATLQPLYDNAGTFTVKVWPESSGTIVYTQISRLYQKPLFGGAIGDASTVDVTFGNGGTAGITRGTA